MLRTVISLGKKSQPRIFVEKGEQSYVVPYWISRKGNLCWKIEEVIYVKNRWGFTSMLVEGKWVKSNASTEATAPTPEKPNLKVLPVRFDFPDRL